MRVNFFIVNVIFLSLGINSYALGQFLIEIVSIEKYHGIPSFFILPEDDNNGFNIEEMEQVFFPLEGEIFGFVSCCEQDTLAQMISNKDKSRYFHTLLEQYDEYAEDMENKYFSNKNSVRNLYFNDASGIHDKKKYKGVIYSIAIYYLDKWEYCKCENINGLEDVIYIKKIDSLKEFKNTGFLQRREKQILREYKSLVVNPAVF